MRSVRTCGAKSAARGVTRPILGVLLASVIASSLSAAPALATAGGGPLVSHLSAIKGGHEGPAEGSTAGGTEVVVSGSNLLSGAESCLFTDQLGGWGAGSSLPGCSNVIVRFGTEPGLVAFASKHRIDVVSPAHQPGAIDVSVTTADGTSSTHSGDHFKYVGPPPRVGSGPPPKVNAVSPTSGPAGGFSAITISGEHLLPAGSTLCVECALTSARFGKSSVPVLEGTPTELVVVSPPHEPGTVDVVVSAAGLSSVAHPGDRFTYAAPHHHHHHHHSHHHGH